MEVKYEEGSLKGSIDYIPFDKTETILNQMKKFICKIEGNLIGSKFFSKILYKNKITPVLITNYHIIDDNFINKWQLLNY